MKYLLDTSAYSAFNKGDTRLRAVFTSTHELVIPLIVIAELRAGFVAGSRTAQNERLLQHFLDSPNVTTVTLTDQTTRLFAGLHLILKQAGRPIGTNDLWIAALAREHHLPLVTLDSDFEAVPDLQLFPC